MDKNILYISGWLGAGRSSGTFRWLERTYPDTNLDCLAPGGTVDIGDLIEQLKQKLDEKPLVIVANSYGCFLASFFQRYQAVWVNPSLYPSRTLPRIADLSDADIKTLRLQEIVRDALYDECHTAYAIPVTSDSDELIPDHHVEHFTDLKPIIVPGGLHKLTDEQRTLYVKPAIDQKLEIEFPNLA